MTMVERRECRRVNIGPVAVGGGAPVSVQSMTTTPTHDVDATVRQIAELAAIGCRIIRPGGTRAGRAGAADQPRQHAR